MRPWIAAVFLLGVALGMACVPPTPTPTPLPTATPSPTATPAPPQGGVLARIAPESLQVAPGQLALVRVELLVNAVGLSAADLEISYDADGLRVIGIEAGDLLGQDPLVGITLNEPERGRAQIALARVGRTDAPTPNGTLVTVSLQVREGAAPGSRLSLEVTNLTLVDDAFRQIPDVRFGDAETQVVVP